MRRPAPIWHALLSIVAACTGGSHETLVAPDSSIEPEWEGASGSAPIPLEGVAALDDSGSGLFDEASSTPTQETEDASLSADAAACPGPPHLNVVADSTTKICQLTGERDRELDAATLNRTESRANLVGTDLGASFEHGGQLWFLFGDTEPTALGQTTIGYAPEWRDSLATSAAMDSTSCVPLTFQTTTVAARDFYRPPSVPGVDLGVFDVPLHGLSTGPSMYVWFSTNCMSTSLLARSDDDSLTFTPPLYTLSDCGCGAGCATEPAFGPKPTEDAAACSAPTQCHFVNVQAQIVAAAQASGLAGFDAAAPADQLVLFGSGAYRHSDVYLATAPLAEIENKAALRYFAGFDSGSCAPTFSPIETDAAPIFRTAGEHGPDSCVGELSVHYSTPLGLWLVMYNCNNRILIRAARLPWGPYSAASTALDPNDGAYCSYIYKVDAGCPGLSDPKDPHGGNAGPSDTGGVYGPYAIPRYTVVSDAGTSLTFVLSTHNPYNTMLMQTTVR